MNHTIQKFAVATSVALSLTAMNAPRAQAAIVTYDIDVDILFGPLMGQMFTGLVSFNDSSLSGSEDESLPITNVEFEFLGVDYTEADDLSATVEFFDGDFLGLNFSGVDSSTGDSFTFVSGAFGFAFPPTIDEAFFTYNLPGSTPIQGGDGDVTYILQQGPPPSVPEPTSMLSLFALGIIGCGMALDKRN